jgi:hypothetical protein
LNKQQLTLAEQQLRLARTEHHCVSCAARLMLTLVDSSRGAWASDVSSTSKVSPGVASATTSFKVCSQL